MDFEAIYKKYNVPKRTIEHMEKVAKIALILADMLDLEVDKKLLAEAALTHDIGVSYYRGRTDLNDFERYWGHQVKTREWLEREGYPKVADVASRHNAHGLTAKESKEWGAKKAINLLPNSVESKILAFADSMRKRFVREGDCITIFNLDYAEALKRHNMLKKAEQRKKRLFNFLIKHGMNYEELLQYIE